MQVPGYVYRVTKADGFQHIRRKAVECLIRSRSCKSDGFHLVHIQTMQFWMTLVNIRSDPLQWTSIYPLAQGLRTHIFLDRQTGHFHSFLFTNPSQILNILDLQLFSHIHTILCSSSLHFNVHFKSPSKVLHKHLWNAQNAMDLFPYHPYHHFRCMAIQCHSR